MRIGIDCGHTLKGQNTGASGNGYREEKLTRAVGVEVIKLLQKQGHSVFNCTIDTASSSVDSLKKRVEFANRQPLDLFISIHFNAFNESANGTEVFVYNKNSKCMDKAIKVCDKLAELGYKRRGVKVNPDLYVLRNTNAPAMLVEVCFVDSSSDMERYARLGVQRHAKAIVEGILGVSIEDNTETAHNGFWRVIAGSYTVRDNAYAMVDKLKELGISSFIEFKE